MGVNFHCMDPENYGVRFDWLSEEEVGKISIGNNNINCCAVHLKNDIKHDTFLCTMALVTLSLAQIV